MFCQKCLTSIQAVYENLHLALSKDTYQKCSKALHESLSSLYQSVVEGCWICRQIWTSMLEDYFSDHERNFSQQNGSSGNSEGRFVAEFELLWECRETKNLSIELQMFYRDDALHMALNTAPYRSLELILSPTKTTEAEIDASVRSSLFSSTLITENPGLWSDWFGTCSKSHEKCRVLHHKLQPFLPSRLVEIVSNDNGNSFNWRIICCADIGDVQYLTLSHCWGSSGHTSLKRETFSAFSELTTFSILPKTFQHAILITFSLGFRFIWIDSLCIVQDDPKDWEAQASIMGSIYKNASLNIAATWAEDGNGGCFTTKESRKITLALGLHQSKEYDVDSRLLYYDDILEAPLNARGWVTQERFLARRQLSFARSQVYWECRELVASEQYPQGIPRCLWDLSPYNQAAPPAGKPTLDYTTESDCRDAWAALVDYYSNCNFSRLSDRMVALAGLAEEMRNITGDQYLAGLWRKDLLNQLCWSTDFDVRWRSNRFTVPTYLAPTWSWANASGPVLSDQRYHHKFECASFVEILKVSIHSEHSSKLHSFVASSLVLRGIAVKARAVSLGNPGHRLDSSKHVLRFTGPNNDSYSLLKGGIRVSIHWDENMSGSEDNPDRWPIFLEERQSEILCMFVYIEIKDSVVGGLVLRKLPDISDKNVYVRMGTFFNYDGDFSDRLSMELGYPPGHSIVEDIDLNNTYLAGLVHTVTVI